MCTETVSNTRLRLFGLMNYVYVKKTKQQTNIYRKKGSKLNILDLSMFFLMYLIISCQLSAILFSKKTAC